MDCAEVKSLTLVDNASSDGSNQTPVPQGLRNVRISRIENDVNQGFGKACNLGSARGNAPYVLFLNPDTRLRPKCMLLPLKFLEAPENQDIAVAGIQLIDNEGNVARSCCRIPTPYQLLMHSVGVDRLPLISPRGYMMTEWSHNDTRRVGHVIGAYYLIRRSIFEELGGFDEDFFVYLEDLDLSTRIARKNLACAYLSHISAFHAGGGSSRKILARRLCYSLKSRLIYSQKHYNRFHQLLIKFATLVVEPLIRCSRALLVLSWRDFKVTCRGYGLLYRDLFKSAQG